MMVISEASRPQDWYLILSRIRSGSALWDVLYSGSLSWVKARLVVVATQAKMRKNPANKVFRGSPLIRSLAVVVLSVSEIASYVLAPLAPTKQKGNIFKLFFSNFSFISICHFKVLIRKNT